MSKQNVFVISAGFELPTFNIRPQHTCKGATKDFSDASV